MNDLSGLVAVQLVAAVAADDFGGETHRGGISVCVGQICRHVADIFAVTVGNFDVAERA